MNLLKPTGNSKNLFCIFLIIFLFSANNIWARECPQQRKTQVAPSSFQKKTNPLRKEPGHLKKGKVLAHIKAKPIACKQCHGMKGDGQGAMAFNMNPKPRNFTCNQTMDSISDGQLYWIIKNGSKGTAMPSYSYLSDEKIWQLIHYIRSLSALDS
ncbi:MAG: cytochrome c [Candidatus Nitronauta litoralis]|uniref:Cytochrome c n=1 Tax=Candidatus Nitronauta litoralis TaxID=2705533 RepID=A0A7T0BWX4_9BACT|nr:MAG: cytochrome c [Candidatus Nitronauta litoralis]